MKRSLSTVSSAIDGGPPTRSLALAMSRRHSEIGPTRALASRTAARPSASSVMSTSRCWRHRTSRGCARSSETWIEAAALREEVLELARAAGNQRMEAMALQGLAFHAWEAGRFEDALSLIAAGYRIHADLGERDMIAGAISRLARVHAAAGRPLTAAQLLSSSEAYDELGESSIPWIRDLNAETLAMIRAQLDEASLERALARGPDDDARRGDRARTGRFLCRCVTTSLRHGQLATNKPPASSNALMGWSARCLTTDS